MRKGTLPVVMMCVVVMLTSCQRSTQKRSADNDLTIPEPSISLAASVASTLAHDRVPASIVLYGTCDGGNIKDDIQARQNSIGQGNPTELLRTLSKEYPRLGVTKDSSGIWRIVDSRADQRLVDTKVGDRTISTPDANSAIAELFATDEVRGALTKLNLTQAIAYGGLEVPNVHSKYYPQVKLRDATVRDWLDAIGKAYPGVWIFRECRPDNAPGRFKIDLMNFAPKR